MKRISLVLITASLAFLACGPALTLVPTATAGPAVAELLVPNADAGSLIVDAQSLYWSSCDAWESTHGTIRMFSKRQKTVETLTSDQLCPFRLIADESALYWIDHEGIAGGVHHIMRLAKNGGQPQVVTADRSVFQMLLVDDSYLYWWTEERTGMRTPKNGTGQPESLPIPAKYIQAFYGPDSYWQNANGDVIRSRKDGSQAVTLVPGSDFSPAPAESHRISSSIVGVFPRPSGVYLKVYTDGNPGMASCSDQWTTLMRLARDGGKPERVAQVPGFADSLWVGTSVYFADDCTQGIIKVNVESKASEMFFQGLIPIWFLETDGEFIYWVTRGDGSIQRAHK